MGRLGFKPHLVVALIVGAVVLAALPAGAVFDAGKLTADTPQARSYFGYDLAVSGNTMVVGAYGDSEHALDAGAAFVFTRSDGVWSQQAKLTAPDAQRSDRFGDAVAISGDTIVVGAPGAEGPNDEPGVAYTYTRTAGIWSLEDLLIEPGDIRGQFGADVGIDGNTIVVGKGWGEAGAHVYVRDDAGWAHDQNLAPEGVDDSYGWYATISGDTIAVGAFGATVEGIASGAVYVYTPDGGVWEEQARLTPADAADDQYFGGELALEGDMLAVGAEGDDEHGGAVYVFSRSAGQWTEEAKLLPPAGNEGVFSGHALAMSEDTIVVGEHIDGENGDRAGAAYLYRRDQAGWSRTEKLLAPDGAPVDLFGGGAALSGDTIAIGAPLDDLVGSVYLFTNTPTCRGHEATISGTADADTLTGTDQADVIYGGAGSDVIDGKGGDDIICGGFGYDRIQGGPGNDVIDGGEGRNWVSYRGAPSGVTVNLVTGSASGGAGNDTLVAVDHLIGTNHRDLLVGNGMTNRIRGNGGSDVIRGRGGNDHLVGRHGNDTIQGGPGNDTTSYRESPAGVFVDLTAGRASGGHGNDRITSIEHVIGSGQDDTLVGNQRDNRLLGRGGNDVIEGYGGDDALYGHAGDDTLDGGPGADHLYAGKGTNHCLIDGDDVAINGCDTTKPR